MHREHVRTRPRISVNKLGEYLVAAPLRRERIIAEQKRPKAIRTVRYDDAQEVATKFLVGGAREDTYVRREIDRLYNAGSKSGWEARNNLLCAEALESLLDLQDLIPLENLEINRGHPTSAKLMVGEVAISVRPEIIVSGTNRAQEQVTGAIKLYFPKTHPLTDKAGEYVATVVHQFMKEQSVSGKPQHRLCHVIDVNQGKVFSAPSCFKRRWADIEAACREIARAWETK